MRGEEYRMPGFLAWAVERTLVRSQEDEAVWEAEWGLNLDMASGKGACDGQADTSTRPCLIDS